MSIRVAAVLVVMARLAAADPLPEPDLRNPDTALTLSIAGTGASALLFVVGAHSNNSGMMLGGLASSLVTPSLGHWYSDHYLTAGLGIRAVSATVFVLGLADAFQHSCWDSCDNYDHSGENFGVAMMAVGMIGYAAGTIYDIATAPRAARDYNEKHRVTARLMPTVLMPPSGPVMGVGIGGHF